MFWRFSVSYGLKDFIDGITHGWFRLFSATRRLLYRLITHVTLLYRTYIFTIFLRVFSGFRVRFRDWTQQRVPQRSPKSRTWANARAKLSRVFAYIFFSFFFFSTDFATIPFLIPARSREYTHRTVVSQCTQARVRPKKKLFSTRRISISRNTYTFYIVCGGLSDGRKTNSERFLPTPPPRPSIVCRVVPFLFFFSW